MGAKSRANVMPDIRGGLKRFMLQQAQKGKPISEMWADLYEQDVKSFFQMAVAVHPKELMIEVDGNIKIDTPNIDSNQLKEVIEARRELGQPDLREVS